MRKPSKIDAENLPKSSKIPSWTPPGRLPNGGRKRARKGKPWDYRIRGVWGTQNRDPERSEGLQKPSKFHSFFDIVSTRFSWPLGPQHGTQNPSKSMKNRDRHRSLSWSPLNIRCSSKFGAKMGAAEEREKHFRLGNHTILIMPACWRSSQNSTRFSSQKRSLGLPKSFKNRTKDASERVPKSE